MTIEQKITELTAATTRLLDAVNVSKQTLDEKTASSAASAEAAAARLRECIANVDKALKIFGTAETFAKYRDAADAINTAVSSATSALASAKQASEDQKALSGYKSQIDSTVAAQKAEYDRMVAAQKQAYDAWQNDSKASFALPYQVTIEVGGEADLYYPVPVADTVANRIGRIVINAEHAQTQCVIDLAIRGDQWHGAWLTRIEMYKIWAALTLGRIETQLIGRMIWLRGGGRKYKISADFSIQKDRDFFGTKQLVPILSPNTPIYTGHPVAPYAGGNFRVSPLTTPDARWANEINLPTLL